MQQFWQPLEKKIDTLHYEKNKEADITTQNFYRWHSRRKIHTHNGHLNAQTDWFGYSFAFGFFIKKNFFFLDVGQFPFLYSNILWDKKGNVPLSATLKLCCSIHLMQKFGRGNTIHFNIHIIFWPNKDYTDNEMRLL